jgi:signal transduction histidine kinase
MMLDATKYIQNERNFTLEKSSLERINILKTDLMRMISHELRTPLAVIMGFAEITAMEAQKSGISGEFTDNLNAIAAESKRMANMIEEMRRLSFAREYSKDRRPVDLAAVINQISGLYAKVLEQKGITLTRNIINNLPLVYGNDNELVQVIFNLLRNAETHTENGSVTINTEISDGFVKVSVSDTGSGISPELLPRIFELGVHGDKEGSGYGLAICHDIINAYGGKIWIESTENIGTDAMFALPLYTGEGGDSDIQG